MRRHLGESSDKAIVKDAYTENTSSFPRHPTEVRWLGILSFRAKGTLIVVGESSMTSDFGRTLIHGCRGLDSVPISLYKGMRMWSRMRALDLTCNILKTQILQILAEGEIERSLQESNQKQAWSYVMHVYQMKSVRYRGCIAHSLNLV